MSEPARCPECGFCGGWHGWSCRSVPEEALVAHLRRYAETFLNGQERYRAAAQQRNGVITALQGKCAVLQHENNQLRRKLRRAAPAGGGGVIYLFSEGEEDAAAVTAVFEAAAGVAVDRAAFLATLGVPPFPVFEAARVGEWSATGRAWQDEKLARLRQQGIANEVRAHREWLERHPQVRAVAFTELD